MTGESHLGLEEPERNDSGIASDGPQHPRPKGWTGAVFLSVLFGVTAAVAAPLALTVRDARSGFRESPPHYEGVGGAFREAFHGLVMFAAGIALGTRVGWLAGAWRSRRYWGAHMKRGHLDRRDFWRIAAPGLVALYLIYSANFW